MNEFKNPFADFDFNQIMGEFKVPNVDVDAMVATQKKNIDALTNANQLAIEGMQAVALRQAEIIRETVEMAQAQMGQVNVSGNPEEAVAQQTELLKASIERAVNNARELSEMVAKSNAEAFDIVNQRVTESLDEIKDLAKTA